MAPSRKHIVLSLVAPCYNEEKSLQEFVHRTEEVLKKLKLPFELILVNDGSNDRTLEVGKELTKTDPRLKIVTLSRNFGHQIAATAGMDVAQGDAVVLIDADLQDPPELIPEMVAKWREGFDVVYGQRRSRAGEAFFKLFTARMFYRLLRRITKVDIPLDTGDFRLMDRKVVEAMRQLRERHRFVRGLVSWTGFRQAPLLYDRRPRFAGETHYPFRKMFLFSLDAITSFSILPLRLMTFLGLFIVLIAMILSLVVLIVRLIEPEYFLAGFPTIVLLIMFFGGIQLLSLGVMGEYVGRIYEEVKHRPLYFVDSIYQNGSRQDL